VSLLTEYYLDIILAEGSPWAVVEEYVRTRKELGVSGGRIDDVLKFMLYKGIKYIPAIAYTAYELRRNYEFLEGYTAFELFIKLAREQSRMLVGAYRYLRKRIKGARTLRRFERLRPFEEGWCEVGGTRVIWPPEVLDLEEVQEEMRRLSEGNLLSKDDPMDREIVRRHLMDTEKGMYRAKGEVVPPIEVRVDEFIEYVNSESKAWSTRLSIIRELHHRHPDVMFYLYGKYD
jgi:hypothetical protein